MKIIGYGICGPGEANRYMTETLECFKRLCDEVIILCNNCDQKEIDLIDSFGFRYVRDRREWGRWQWKIKQDFIERDIKQMAQEGDMLLCLDMDEVVDSQLTREWIQKAPLDAYHLFVVDLWNEGYKPESCFWNVRLWRWNGNTKFKQKPVHCGLAPEWTYHYHRFAPFLLIHSGLKEKADRERKILRYKRYDPKAEHLDHKYYKMLESDICKPLDEENIHNIISKEVESYKQTTPKNMMNQKKPERFAYVETPSGSTIDIPERHLKQTLARGGFKFLYWADEVQSEMDELFKDVDIEEPDPKRFTSVPGSYQGSTNLQKNQFDAMNKKDEDDEVEIFIQDKEFTDRIKTVEKLGVIESVDTLYGMKVEKPKSKKGRPKK